jgi:hypothetical protein
MTSIVISTKYQDFAIHGKSNLSGADHVDHVLGVTGRQSGAALVASGFPARINTCS